MHTPLCATWRVRNEPHPPFQHRTVVFVQLPSQPRAGLPRCPFSRTKRAYWLSSAVPNIASTHLYSQNKCPLCLGSRFPKPAWHRIGITCHNEPSSRSSDDPNRLCAACLAIATPAVHPNPSILLPLPPHCSVRAPCPQNGCHVFPMGRISDLGYSFLLLQSCRIYSPVH